MATLRSGLLLALACMAAPLAAQEDPAAELDLLARQTASAEGGMALARSQSDNGDLLGALGTIDRVLIVEPGTRPALLMRAYLLCRIDDRQGGAAQLGRLKKRDFAKANWDQVSAACARQTTNPAAGTAPASESDSPQRNRRWQRPGF